MIELTKDANKMICVIYKMYLQKIKNGNSKTASRGFRQDFYKQDKLISSWHPDDIQTTLSELGKKGYLKSYIDGSFNITESMIIYMENRFKNGLKEVLNYVSGFSGIL